MNEKLLLSLLENNARLSVTDLAVALGEAEDKVYNCMSELEKAKIICGYHTIINWDKTNFNKIAALITVDVTPEEDFGYDRIAEKIYKYDEVTSMYLMSGKSEFSVYISGHTMQDIANFVGTKLACIDGVQGTSTYFILKEYKIDGVIFDKEKETKERMLISA